MRFKNKKSQPCGYAGRPLSELILRKDICFHPGSRRPFTTQLPVWDFPLQVSLPSWSALSDDNPSSAEHNHYLRGLRGLILPDPCLLLQPDIFHFVHFAAATWTSFFLTHTNPTAASGPLYLLFSLLGYSFPRSPHGFRSLLECHPHRGAFPYHLSKIAPLHPFLSPLPALLSWDFFSVSFTRM